MIVSLYVQVKDARAFRGRANELTGIWAVERWAADGVERPALTSDRERWRKLLIANHELAIRQMNDTRIRYPCVIDPGTRTITVARVWAEETWHYRRIDDGHLEIEGTWAGRRIDVKLVREAPSRLVSRGFNWIQPAAYSP